MSTTQVYPNKATKALVRRISKRVPGSTFTNVAVWAKTLGGTYSETRTAFQYAVDRGLLTENSGGRGTHKVFVRTSLPV